VRDSGPLDDLVDPVYPPRVAPPRTLPALPVPSLSAARLTRELARAEREPACELDALHDAVGLFVREAKAAGLPPEKVLVMLKEHVHRATSPHIEHRDYSVRMKRVIEWFLAAYYRADQG
jgi:hypothetical protein